ncbi:MAG: hypothetical protein KIT87_19960 [Anaerolineae bacterium]|nr:hypothetical protein [Anaerolineae bacterium]
MSNDLTLVSAPPGFGKTTLVSQWLHERIRGQLSEVSHQSSASGPPPAVAWLTLDEGDNDFDRFLRYLIAAVRSGVPDVCPTTIGLLDAIQRPGVDYLADVLVAELNALAIGQGDPTLSGTGQAGPYPGPIDLILVLDDYHLIHSQAVPTILRHLLRYRPPWLHPVILTRIDPPLHLGRLRAAGRLTELRAADLRFTAEETRLFLHRRVAQPLDDAALQALHTRTEGWITALQLASLSLQTQAAADFLARFDGGDRLLVGYLVEEVMARLPASVQVFLTRTALLDRFCAPLADALLADSAPAGGSQATIAQLEKRNLFLIPLDSTGTWYRYHDLFRDFLRRRLEQEVDVVHLADLHRRMSGWFSQAGLMDDAIRHALAAGDESLAAEMVEAALHPMLNQQTPWSVLESWLSLFSEPATLAYPSLLVAQAYLFASRHNVAALPPLLDRLDRLLHAEGTLSRARRQALQAHYDELRGYSLYWLGEAGRAIVPLERAVASLSDSHAYARAQAIFHLTLAYAHTGQQAAGLTLLHTALNEATAYQRPTSLILLGALVCLQMYAADLGETARMAERVVATISAPHAGAAWHEVGIVDIWRAWANYLHGAVDYERNALAAAAEHWQQVVALSYRANPRAYHESLVGLALVAQAQGVPADALAHAQAAAEFAAQTGRACPLQVSAALSPWRTTCAALRILI